MEMFVKILSRFGLMMIGKQRFQNYFQQRKDQAEGSKLLNRMSALIKLLNTVLIS